MVQLKPSMNLEMEGLTDLNSGHRTVGLGSHIQKSEGTYAG